MRTKVNGHATPIFGHVTYVASLLRAFAAAFSEQFSNFYSSEMSRKELKDEFVEHTHATFVYQGVFDAVAA